jgi:hypothetical protein
MGRGEGGDGERGRGGRGGDKEKYIFSTLYS